MTKKQEFLISFGQSHVHRVNGKTFDCDSLCRVYADDLEEARGIARENFGDRWCTVYIEVDLSFFPRGIIDLERVWRWP